jgi:hypothetical protein
LSLTDDSLSQAQPIELPDEAAFPLAGAEVRPAALVALARRRGEWSRATT